MTIPTTPLTVASGVVSFTTDMLFQTLLSILFGAVAGVIAAVFATWILRRQESRSKREREKDQIDYLRLIIMKSFEAAQDEKIKENYPLSLPSHRDLYRKLRLRTMCTELTTALDHRSSDIDYRKTHELRTFLLSMRAFLWPIEYNDDAVVVDLNKCQELYDTVASRDEKLAWLNLPADHMTRPETT